MAKYTRQPIRRGQQTAYVREYRADNEAYAIYHRGSSQKRRDVTSDVGDRSVTVEFLTELYRHENCYYCGSYTPKEKRTADHKRPLSRGGKHTKRNLVMACQFCNCSKRNKTEMEFKKYVRSKNYC